MHSGVLKSGSPMLRLITSFPSSFSCLLLRVMASVADSDNFLTLSDKYSCFISTVFLLTIKKDGKCINFHEYEFVFRFGFFLLILRPEEGCVCFFSVQRLDISKFSVQASNKRPATRYKRPKNQRLKGVRMDNSIPKAFGTNNFSLP
jgi:hypothetical protein